MISVTGFTAETIPTREQVKCAIDMIGACYLGPLCKDHTTHLICLDELSEKYRAASQWGSSIHCVTCYWLFDCLKYWKYMNEKEYSFHHDDGYSRNREEENEPIREEEQEVLQSPFDLSDK